MDIGPELIRDLRFSHPLKTAEELLHRVPDRSKGGHFFQPTVTGLAPWRKLLEKHVAGGGTSLVETLCFRHALF